ncbi:MAG: zinc ribbon domain-containing protein [Candidatus Methanomethylophilaceae archaeon]|nr:zinc ribbon domain-containing protein [Candidatus Methanomethylophilaceae archaeon]
MASLRYFVPLFPALWLVYAVLLFLTRAHDRTSMIFFGIMILVCVAATIYLSIYAYGPIFMSKMKEGTRCPVCYGKLDPETGFCPKCGNVVDPSKESRVSRCAKCGYDVEDPDKDFCPKCGNMLKK